MIEYIKESFFNFIDFLYQLFITFLDESSVEARLILNTVAIIIMIHLLVKRIIEIRRKDFISPFRIAFVIMLTVILTMSIPVEWSLINRWIGIENIALTNFARVAGGIIIFAFVLMLEAVDIVIGRINARAKKIEDQSKNNDSIV